MDNINGRRETRYGMPTSDQTLINNNYIVGYSYYFRQAKWVLEVIKTKINESDQPRTHLVGGFRPDYRIPELYRPDLVTFDDSGYDRHPLYVGFNQNTANDHDIDTLLLSSISPQSAGFYMGAWKELEERIGNFSSSKKVYETYVISGPIFYYGKTVKTIGYPEENEVTLPIPHAYFRSILTENTRGKLDMWSFIIPNDNANKPLESFLVSTTKLERLAGISLWKHLSVNKYEKKKNQNGKKFW